MSLALNEPHGILCSSFKFKHYLRPCTTSGMKVLILYANQPIENYRGQTLGEKSHGLKGELYCLFNSVLML